MAKEKRLHRAPPTDRNDSASDEFSAFAREEAEDGRILKVSLWGAVAFHAVLLLINFPAFNSAPRAEERNDKKIYVVEQVRFKPPVVEKREIPPKRIKRQPVPDPTPDDPEPIRMEEPTVDLEVPDVDTDFLAIPDAPPEPDPEPIRRPGGDVQEPVKIHAPRPLYTEIARRARIEGKVFLEAIIDREGNVADLKVLKGLPMGLTEETVKAVRQWKFKPATLHGKPVDVYFTLTVNFQLQ